MPSERSPPFVEAIPGDGAITDQGFAAAVASCAAGDLVFRPPFDLTTSALLALVQPGGPPPLAFVLATRDAAPLIRTHITRESGRVHVCLHQLSPVGTSLPAREIIDAFFADDVVAEEVIADALEQLGLAGDAQPEECPLWPDTR